MGVLIASMDITLQPLQKRVSLFEDLLGLSPDASGADLTRITSDAPIPAPIFIAGKAGQSHHILFPGFPLFSF